MERYYVLNNRQAPSFFTRFVANMLALGLSAYLISEMDIDGVFALVISAFIFTILNAIVKPILVVLTLPLTVITLGLFYPVVNVIIISLLDVIMGGKFIVEGFFNAILVSIIVAIVNYAVTHMFKEDRSGIAVEIHED